MKPCAVGGTQASEPSVVCFQIHLCAVMQIYDDFGWELLFWQSVGCLLWCFPLTRQAQACQDFKRADNDTVSIISVERNYLSFKWLHSSLLRTLHGNCHNATLLKVLPLLPSLLTVFTMLNKAKFWIDTEMSWRFWDFFKTVLVPLSPPMPVEILHSKGFEVAVTYSRKISTGSSLFQSHWTARGYILNMLYN